MSNTTDKLAACIADRFGDSAKITVAFDEVTMEVAAADVLAVCGALRDEPEFGYELLMDLCGVDYLHFGLAEWETSTATGSGFSRGVTRTSTSVAAEGGGDERRFAVVYHLLSVKNNSRLRVKVFLHEDEPVVDSVTGIWSSADWYEREAFDLFGIMFVGHPDLRRLLTDYGFIGHPFRKDFPLIGNVEMRYDEEKRRVVYEPVSIEPRTLVPRVIRDDRLVFAQQDADAAQYGE